MVLLLTTILPAANPGTISIKNLDVNKMVSPELFAIEIIERHIEAQKINIKNANIIVAGGYGVGTKENFKLLFDLAEVLGGEVGANKLSYKHPERANKLREYGKSKQDPSIFDKEWDFLVYGDYTGTVTAKLKQYRTTTGYYFETVRENLKGAGQPSIGRAIHVTKNGIVWGGDNINGMLYVADRRKALELKKVLSELGYDISVNNLYTECDPNHELGHFTEIKTKHPWFCRRQ